MTSYSGKGGRIPPDGRPPQAKGVGKNAKRHDLERPKTPGLHGSDLQKGDVQAMEQGQRIAPATTQQPAAAQPAPNVGSQPTSSAPMNQMEIPDAIEFLSEQNGDQFNLPQPHRQIDNSAAMTWMPILRQLATGPGSSGLFASLLIQQARKMQQAGSQPATIVDMDAGDDAIQAMLDVGVRSSQDFSEYHRAVPMPAGNPDHFTEGQGQPGLGRVNPKSYRPQGGSA